MKKSFLFCLLIVISSALFYCNNSKSIQSKSDFFIQTSEQFGGVCVLIGEDQTDNAQGIANAGAFNVQVLVPEQDKLADVRQTLQKTGLYGTISANIMDMPKMPYVENLINLIIISDFTNLNPKKNIIKEINRVLAPKASAFIKLNTVKETEPQWQSEIRTVLSSLGLETNQVTFEKEEWLVIKKPWPADIDEWTHNTHAPDGNPVAQDTRVGRPRHFQWVSDPLWMRGHDTDSSVQGLVTANGRIFYLEDQAPSGLPGQHELPDKWFLVARDAFNGRLLWKVRIKEWGWRQWKKTWYLARPGSMPINIHRRLVAVGDTVYATLGYHAPVSQLDARTGEILKVYNNTENTNEIIVLNDGLILSMLRPEGIKVMSLNTDGQVRWQTDPKYKGTVTEFIKWESMRGEVEPAILDPSVNLAVNEKNICLIDDHTLVCLDFKTGTEQWRTELHRDNKPHQSAISRYSLYDGDGGLWAGTLILYKDVVIHAGSEQMVVLDVNSGDVLWTTPKQTFQWLWFQWKDVFVIDDLLYTWSYDLNTVEHEGRRYTWPATVNAFDIHSGKVVKKIPLGDLFSVYHHHRCYRNKATPNFILASRRGTEFVDLQDGKHSAHNWIRGTCHMGMMPANGLQYAPPHPCRCYINEKLNGFCAVSSGAQYDSSDPVLQKGSAFGNIQVMHATESDWPAYRYDNLRRATTQTPLADELQTKWQTDLGKSLSPPIVAGNHVFVANVGAHQVTALNVKDGSRVWDFTAGARIDSPPTFYQGTLLFGSRDGWVYCVRSTDGSLVWRFRAAPAERWMGAFDQLESVWPIHGSILIKDDIAYFVAGRSSYLDGGLLLYGLEPRTGEIIHQGTLAGPHLETGTYPDQFNYNMGPGALPDILQADDEYIYLRQLAFNNKLEKRESSSDRIRTMGGFLDDTYFRRSYWFYGKNSLWARIMIEDDDNLFHVRMFDDMRLLDPFNYFVPGQKGYRLSRQRKNSDDFVWSRFVPIRVKAMAKADDVLLVAGPPDVVDPKDPLGAFEGRKGGLLWLFKVNKGLKLGEYQLPSPPVFNGLAVANKALFISTRDGHVICMSK